MEASAVGSIHDAVELLSAVLTTVSPDDHAAMANPELAGLCAVLREAREHPAVKLLARLRAQVPRDRVIKEAVLALAGSDAASAQARILGRVLTNLASTVAPRWEHALAEPRARARALMAPLLAEFDPPAAMAELCRAPIQVEFHVHPVIFLPLPQDGRHGVKIQEPDGRWTVHMFFGIPLTKPLAEAFIDRAWLQRGGWHYVTRYFIEQSRASFTDRLAAADRALSEQLTRAMPVARFDSIGALFIYHLSLTLRYGLFMRAGMQKRLFMRLSESQGGTLISWFAGWMDRYLDTDWRRGAPLSAAVPQLADAFVAEMPALVALAKAPPSLVPNVIGCALLPLWKARARVVVPDAWLSDPSPEDQQLVRAWSAFRMEVCSRTAWEQNVAWHRAPAVLYGSPACDPEIARVLERLRVAVREDGADLGDRPVQGPDLTLVALDRGADTDAPWRLVVAAHRGAPRPDSYRLLSLRCARAVLRGEALVDSVVEDDFISDYADLVL
jgi:hypothetical protein